MCDVSKPQRRVMASENGRRQHVLWCIIWIIKSMVIDPTVMAEQRGGGKGMGKENKEGMKEGDKKEDER